MLDVRRLDPTTFTDQERSSFLEMAQQQPLSDSVNDLIAIGAYWDGKPCGLLVLSYVDVLTKGEVEQLFVDKAFRGRGVGSTLLQFSSDYLKELGCKTFVLLFSDDIEGKESLEHILERQGWRKPSLYITRYHFHCPSFRPDWLYEPHPLPPEITMHDWSELTQDEKELIDHQVEQGVFSYSLYPFSRKTEPELSTSVFLRTEGKVIGWSACHLEKPDTLTYTALYLHRAHRGARVGIVIAAESVLRQQRGTIPYSIFDVQVRAETDVWAKFVAKSVEAHALRTSGVWSTWKRLVDEPTD